MYSQVTILLNELELLNNRINVLITYDGRLLNLLLIIIGVGFGFSVSNIDINDYLMVFFPFAMYTILYFFIHIYRIVNSLMGYKKFIEEYINKNILEKNILLFGEISYNFNFKSKGMYYSYFGYSLLLITGVYKSIEVSFVLFEKYYCFCVIFLHLVFLTMLFIALFELRSTFDKAYAYSKSRNKTKVNL